MPQGDDPGFRTVRGYQQLGRQQGGLTPALEDYLEMISRLCLRDDYARVGRLAELLHVQPSSASKMVAKLTGRGYVRYERYEIIRLTARGREQGNFLLRRHDTVDRFLQLIGVRDSLEETELIEHSVTPVTLGRLERLLDFFAANPAARQSFADFPQPAES